MPFTRRPFLVKTWTYAADELPDDESGIAAWIEQQWDEVDAWVGEHSPDPLTPARRREPARGASGVERA